MKLVIVETPYKAVDTFEQSYNIDFARQCAHDCLVNHDEAPFLSHLLYTQPGILDDSIDSERQLGIDAGLVWGAKAEATVCYVDRGISTGMQYGLNAAKDANRPIIFRHLGNRKYFVVILNRSVHLTDLNQIDSSKREVIISPGSCAVSRIGNPKNPNFADWFILANTAVGATIDYFRANSDSISEVLP